MDYLERSAKASLFPLSVPRGDLQSSLAHGVSDLPPCSLSYGLLKVLPFLIRRVLVLSGGNPVLEQYGHPCCLKCIPRRKLS